MRKARLESDIYKVLSSALVSVIKNKDIVGVDITSVELAPSLLSARVFVEISAPDKDKVLEALKKSKGALKKEIADNIKMRVIPDLTFILDKGGDNARKVDELLAKIKTTGTVD
jgi:ribosome-binding factor A